MAILWISILIRLSRPYVEAIIFIFIKLKLYFLNLKREFVITVNYARIVINNILNVYVQKVPYVLAKVVYSKLNVART
jgi:hypothetical protein